MPKVLLTGKWPEIEIEPGKVLTRISPDKFEGRLFNINNLYSMGVPSLFARPFSFSKRLEKDDKCAFRIFSMLIQGIFLGVIEPRRIKRNILGHLGDVALDFHNEFGEGIIVLNIKISDNEEIPIGGIYPECLVFPGPKINILDILGDLDENNIANIRKRLNIKNDDRSEIKIMDGLCNSPDILNNLNLDENKKDSFCKKIKTFNKLKSKIEIQVEKYGRNNVGGRFRQWVENITEQWRDDRKRQPLWSKLLRNMVEEEGDWDAHNIDITMLPLLKNNSLQLLTVNVSDASYEIPIIRYMEHLITCNKTNDGTTVNLSEKDVELNLGKEKRILDEHGSCFVVHRLF